MSSKSGGRSESERRRDPEVLRRLWERQVARYGPELAASDGGWVPGADLEGGSLTDEQLAEARARIDAALGPGAAETLLGMWSGPLSDADRAAVAEFPDVLPGTTVDDFVAGREQMRRMFGDLRPGAGDPRPVQPSDVPAGPSDVPAGPDAERPTGR